MKFKAIEGYVPDSRKLALENVDYLQGELYDVCAGMMAYATKEEFLAWVDEVWERAFNDYQDFLSRPQS